MSDGPRIYVASLSDYNAGRLHGAWIDADQDADAIREEITAMLAASPEPVAEEYAIHDHDGFAGWEPGEFADLDTVADVARMIGEHGEPFAAWLENDSSNADRLEEFDEQYAGTWETVDDFVYEFAQDAYHDQIAKTGPDYFAYDRLRNDLEAGGEIWTARVSDGIAVFRSY